jgi:hypothetical protein
MIRNSVFDLEREVTREAVGIDQSFQNQQKFPHFDPRITRRGPQECAKCLPVFLLGIKVGYMIFCITLISAELVAVVTVVEQHRE